ncbi:5'/3'-nucleotidase sure family protein [Myriangium duriaei CBS 260.36]|uniref:5'/3'-nucleotidase sure family protein n=1 Tax=Myriangium duriaei CBS 260.36 TaxID=1168546 RepID=A0A9P4MII8_9PEZI|nr:5'/3'-nucleotidase sure family protein [Myriangium duriaei CBS 260.36]
MRLSPATVLALPAAANAFNLVLSNDDGWAEINIRTFYNALTAAGEKVILSAPALNKSGTSSSDAPPTTLNGPCEFNSCPSGSPPTGSNATNPYLNYVNSYPATAMAYGIQTLAPKLFNGGKADFAVSGFNVGSNTGLTGIFSGTIGAAGKAASLGVPSIAFSGTTGDQTAWTAPTPLYASIYADLAVNLTETVLKSGTPYLPANVYLNVNLGAVSPSACTKASDFKFVLSRLYTAVASPDDVQTCGSKRLPTESTVMKAAGCYVSVSVANATNKRDAYSAQAPVLAKLGGLLSCLPE